MIRKKTEIIYDFILSNVTKNPKAIAKLTIDKFGISRQAVTKHLRKLIDKGDLEASGTTSDRTYRVKAIVDKTLDIPITADLAEDRVWRQDIKDSLISLPENIQSIYQYGFTEMFNNVLDHSEATKVLVRIRRTAVNVDIWVLDNGVGIFDKIKNELNLEDHRHAILELTKGKLTTDPERHTGEGIFFTSRMFDNFSISSGFLGFIHHAPDDDWLIEDYESKRDGTGINMSISTRSTRVIKEVFDKFAPEFENHGFSKTHVPVNLFRYGEENLVSRSQAKRILARFENFKEVFLDFEGVNSIGQAFADEIFRVFHKQNPEIKLTWSRTNDEVEKMIKRVSEQLNNSPGK